MFRSAMIALLLCPLCGCAATLRLPADPLEMTILQRQTRAIPGSGKRVLIRLGDVTGGQVLLTIHTNHNTVLLDTRSVKPGDVVPFDVGEQRFFLSVTDLRNFLTGDDFGVFEVSATRPAPRDPDPAPADAPARSSGRQTEPITHDGATRSNRDGR